MRDNFPAQGPPQYPGFHHLGGSHGTMKHQRISPAQATYKSLEWLICLRWASQLPGLGYHACVERRWRDILKTNNL